MNHLPPPAALEDVQRWMQAAITHPAGVARGIESAEAEIDGVPSRVEQVVTPSRAMTALERLEIYHRAYFARLQECLRDEYSVLAAALGAELFDTFTLGYLHECPSTSYTLGRLGARFPEYLAATRPALTDAQSGSADWPEFLIDLARLERAINEVFDGPGAEGRPLLSPDRLREIPVERRPDVRLACVPCLRLMEFGFPVNDSFSAIRRGEAFEFPEREPSFVALTRREYRVWRYPLVARQYDLLSALYEGKTIGAAIARLAHGQSQGAVGCAERSESHRDQLVPSQPQNDEFAVELNRWFFDWEAAGFFSDVVVSNAAAT
ncbi:MAG: HvfC/BufC N-terminal domain-containing protein [Planctomycetaceae bacterium]